MLPQRRSARYSYNFQAYWMEYEYELKEHGFSSEEDYILKLTDMPFEEMFHSMTAARPTSPAPTRLAR